MLQCSQPCRSERRAGGVGVLTLHRATRRHQTSMLAECCGAGRCSCCHVCVPGAHGHMPTFVCSYTHDAQVCLPTNWLAIYKTLNSVELSPSSVILLSKLDDIYSLRQNCNWSAVSVAPYIPASLGIARLVWPGFVYILRSFSAMQAPSSILRLRTQASCSALRSIACGHGKRKADCMNLLYVPLFLLT